MRRAADAGAGVGQLAGVPPPWASSRVKLDQMFHEHGLHPPADIVETASFLATLTFVRERPKCLRRAARH